MTEYTGPSDETLRALAQNLPQMAQQALSGKILGKGNTCSPVTVRPTKVCPVCQALFGAKLTGGLPREETCRECQNKLDQGMTACVFDGKNRMELPVREFAFCRFPHNPKVAGLIIRINESQMNRIQQKYDAQTAKQPNGVPKPVEPDSRSGDLSG